MQLKNIQSQITFNCIRLRQTKTEIPLNYLRWIFSVAKNKLWNGWIALQSNDKNNKFIFIIREYQRDKRHSIHDYFGSVDMDAIQWTMSIGLRELTDPPIDNHAHRRTDMRSDEFLSFVYL